MWCCRPSLALNALDRLMSARQFFAEEFQRDETAELRILGFIDDTYPATTDPFDDAIVGNDLADGGWGISHARGILWRGQGQVNEASWCQFWCQFVLQFDAVCCSKAQRRSFASGGIFSRLQFHAVWRINPRPALKAGRIDH
jgi:hypothetical protein